MPLYWPIIYRVDTKIHNTARSNKYISNRTFENLIMEKSQNMPGFAREINKMDL